MSHSSEKQAERQQRGEDFQAEIRRSWRLIPHCWRLRITDSVNRIGTRPADNVVLLEDINILSEEKRTAGDRFKLSFLRTDQLQGLLDFDAVIKRNKGLVFISFLNDAVDDAYAFRLADALVYMKQQNRQYVTLDELRRQVIPSVRLTTIQLTENGETVRGYDLKGVQECYKQPTATT